METGEASNSGDPDPNPNPDPKSDAFFHDLPPLVPLDDPPTPPDEEEEDVSPLFDPPLQQALRNHYEEAAMPQELKEQYISRISQFFETPLGGFAIDDAKFKRVITKRVCKLPSFFSSALFRKIDTENSGIVTRDKFVSYWVNSDMLIMDIETQIYRILKKPEQEYLSQVDFKPILQELLDTHPGLAFLKGLPQFQESYAETVIYRIFYHINRRENGRLTLRELKKGNLITAMRRVDEEEDTCCVLWYFSYKQYYVIFCKYTEAAPTSHLITQQDLIAYANGSLTSRVIARIFEQAPRRFTCTVPHCMNYEDFVYFLISMEDKSCEPSIDYWFRLLDLDGNRKLTPGEIRYFYEELPVKPVSFEVLFCQLIDMIAPEREDYFTLDDMRRSQLSRIAFNALANPKRNLSFDDRARSKPNGRREMAEWLNFIEEWYEVLSIDAQFIETSSESESDPESEDPMDVDVKFI